MHRSLEAKDNLVGAVRHLDESPDLNGEPAVAEREEIEPDSAPADLDLEPSAEAGLISFVAQISSGDACNEAHYLMAGGEL
jgi:hypothetical protein